MSLRLLAEQDAQSIVEDAATGFGWPVTLTDPSGTVKALTALTNDISQVIDPDTGAVVSGRFVTVSVMMVTLLDEFGALPTGVSDTSVKPWLVTFDDINGVSGTYKVTKTDPDRALGVMTMTLEVYTP